MTSDTITKYFVSDTGGVMKCKVSPEYEKAIKAMASIGWREVELKEYRAAQRRLRAKE